MKKKKNKKNSVRYFSSLVGICLLLLASSCGGGSGSGGESTSSGGMSLTGTVKAPSGASTSISVGKNILVSKGVKTSSLNGAQCEIRTFTEGKLVATCQTDSNGQFQCSADRSALKGGATDEKGDSSFTFRGTANCQKGNIVLLGYAEVSVGSNTVKIDFSEIDSKATASVTSLYKQYCGSLKIGECIKSPPKDILQKIDAGKLAPLCYAKPMQDLLGKGDVTQSKLKDKAGAVFNGIQTIGLGKLPAGYSDPLDAMADLVSGNVSSSTLAQLASESSKEFGIDFSANYSGSIISSINQFIAEEFAADPKNCSSLASDAASLSLITDTLLSIKDATELAKIMGTKGSSPFLEMMREMKTNDQMQIFLNGGTGIDLVLQTMMAFNGDFTELPSEKVGNFIKMFTNMGSQDFSNIKDPTKIGEGMKDAFTSAGFSPTAAGAIGLWLVQYEQKVNKFTNIDWASLTPNLQNCWDVNNVKSCAGQYNPDTFPEAQSGGDPSLLVDRSATYNKGSSQLNDCTDFSNQNSIILAKSGSTTYSATVAGTQAALTLGDNKTVPTTMKYGKVTCYFSVTGLETGIFSGQCVFPASSQGTAPSSCKFYYQKGSQAQTGGSVQCNTISTDSTECNTVFDNAGINRSLGAAQCTDTGAGFKVCSKACSTVSDCSDIASFAKQTYTCPVAGQLCQRQP